MTGSTWESSSGQKGSEGRPRSDSSEPWDERGSINTPADTQNNSNDNNIPTNGSNMRRDPYKYEEEEELEDGDLPRLNLSRSTSGNDRNRSKVVGRNASTNSVPHENIRKMAGGTEELKKQQAFWKQLDSPSTRTNDEDDDTTTDGGAAGTIPRKRRFDKGKIASEAAKASTALHQQGDDRRPPTTEAREDSRNRDSFRMHRENNKGPTDPMLPLRRAESEESEDDTRDSKEYIEGEVDDTNFCDHTLSAMEAICGDAGLQFCGGGATGSTKVTTPNPHSRDEPVRRKKARNLNILNARDESDSVDEHTAIEVEYVEPEDTTGVSQERPENWSPTRKNAYLAAMARKAKEDFEKSQAKEMPSAAALPNRTTAANPESAAQDVYNSFNAAEKRKFLRLINSGMTPSESANRVRAEREKSKETKPSKKGKLFKFWKKGKSKNKANTSMETPSDRDGAGFPVESSFPQEEKKEDDRRPMAETRFEENKDAPSESVGTSEDTSGEQPEESPSQSQTQSQTTYDEIQKDSGSESSSTSPTKQLLDKMDEQSSNSSRSTENNTCESSNPEMERTSPARKLASPAASASVADNAKPQLEDPKNLSIPLDSNKKVNEGVDGRFAKSGINYYDAVRRELSESEDETEYSNQVSVSSKKSGRGPRLGPLLQSPKLQGFSKLTKGGSKANRAMEKYTSPQAPPGSKLDAERTATPPEVHRDTRGFQDKRPGREEEKTEVHDFTAEDNSRDFSFQNVTEYGTANFDSPMAVPDESLNDTSETPSKAEEEALERIEKELLRPVRYAGSLGSTPTASKNVRGGLVTPESSGRAPTPRSQKQFSKLRDQIVAVVSPASTPVAAEAVTPVASKEAKTTATLPTTAMSTPASGMASRSSFAGESPMSSLPSPATLSPALALVATTPPESLPSQHTKQASTTVASKARDLELKQEDLDFSVQEYLNSTEVYSQAGQANDSMSIVSGRSFSTADTGHYGGSVYTQGSSLTQSSRKRRPGAAKTRLAKAKAAENQAAKNKGWHESIRAAAESTNRVWKPKVGWVDYTETSFGDDTADLSTSFASAEKMHLNLSVGKSSKQHQEDAQGMYRAEIPAFQDTFHNEQERELSERIAKQNHLESSPVSNQVQTLAKERERPAVQEHSPTFSPPNVPVSEQANTPTNDAESSHLQQNTPAISPPSSAVPSQQQTPTNHHVQTETPNQSESPPVAKEKEPPEHSNVQSSLQGNPLSSSTVTEQASHRSPDANHKEKRPVEQRRKVTILSVDTSYPPLDDSFLEVPPAPETEHPSPFEVPDPQTTTEGPAKLSLDDMSIEESVAHSVDQFVQSVGAVSPKRSARKKTAPSPNRAQRLSNSPTKRSGWVDSMRAATANIGKDGQSWDPMNGWALADSALSTSALNEDFAPPSTRFEQDTIQERQSEALERIDSECTDESAAEGPGRVEPQMTRSPAEERSERAAQTAPMQLQRQADEKESVAGKGDKGPHVSLIDTSGGFPVESLNVTPTVNVVREKVDEEDISWFPQSRRSSSMVVIPESPEEQNNSAMQSSLASSSKSPGRSGGPADVRAANNTLPVEIDQEGVIWNGVVFETGTTSQTNVSMGNTVTMPKAGTTTRSEPQSQAKEPAADTANNNKSEASRSGSSAPTKSSFSKTVPKLSQSKRDTSPILAKKAQNVEHSQPETRVDQTTPEVTQRSPTQGLFFSESQESPSTTRPVAAAPVGLEANQTDTRKSPRMDNSAPVPVSQGEQARASRSVWRTAASPASSSTSPMHGNVDAASRQPSATNPFVGAPPGPTPVVWPDLEEDYNDDDRYFTRDDGAFPSAQDAPGSPESSSSNVRLRAQQWESRTPREASHEAEQRRSVGSPTRLNSATAEWKMFLGKKVRSESAAAAGQHVYQRDDDVVQHNYIGQSDSLFDFSVADGSVDSRGRSDNDGAKTAHGQPAHHHHHHQQEEPGRHPQERFQEIQPIPEHHAPNEEGNLAPTEILSDYSDGNEINKPFLARLAGCAAPMMPKRNGPAADALAHLTFLRTNNPDGKHGGSKFMPQYLCGRPDVILEEAAETEADGSIEEKKITECDEKSARELPKAQAPQMKNVHMKAKGEVRADTRSVISEDFGAKTAYLEALAMKTAVSKPRRSGSRGRGDRSSAASDVSSSSSKLQQKEKWRDFLERKSRTGASPAKPRGGASDASASAAEHHAAKRVNEMMALMSANRSKSTPRSWRSSDDPDKNKSKSRFVENAIREHTNRQSGYDTASKRNGQTTGRSDSLVAAEQLASARVNAMMQALANDNSTLDEGEI